MENRNNEVHRDRSRWALGAWGRRERANTRALHELSLQVMHASPAFQNEVLGRLLAALRPAAARWRGGMETATVLPRAPCARAFAAPLAPPPRPVKQPPQQVPTHTQYAAGLEEPEHALSQERNDAAAARDRAFAAAAEAAAAAVAAAEACAVAVATERRRAERRA